MCFCLDAIALRSGFTNGQGHILLDNLLCSGYETSLFDCIDPSRIGVSDCTHAEDAGVLCSGTTCLHGSIRLSGSTATQGRVEICHNNVWGAVCAKSWDKLDALVVCRQLGLPTVSTKALKLPTDNMSTVQNYNYQMKCSGSESGLIDCPTEKLDYSDCFQSGHAGVSCDEGTYVNI